MELYLLGLALLAVCTGLPHPDPDLGSALEVAGASGSRYSCDCHEVPSDDGLRTLQCRCLRKSAAESNDQKANTTAQEGPNNGTPAPGGENATSGLEGLGAPSVDESGTQSPVSGNNGTVNGGGTSANETQPGAGPEVSGTTPAGNASAAEELGAGTAATNAPVPVNASTSEPVGQSAGAQNATSAGAQNATAVPENAGTAVPESATPSANGTATGGNANNGTAPEPSTNTTAPEASKLVAESGSGKAQDDEKFFGDTTSYVICLKRSPDAPASSKPVWDWLYRNGKKVEIPGKWVKAKCSDGVLDLFMVQPSKYRDALDSCKKLGFQVTQPSNYAFSRYYAFQVGQSVADHFNRISTWTTTTYQLIKETLVAKCSSKEAGGEGEGAKNNTAADSGTFGDTTTSVVCVKRGTSRWTSKPDWEWLKNKNGKSVSLPGKWVKLQCSYGSVSAFIAKEDQYKLVLDGCKKKGYELAQPGDSTLGGWYPFQINDDIVEYYKESKGWVSNSYDRQPRVGAEKC